MRDINIRHLRKLYKIALTLAGILYNSLFLIILYQYFICSRANFAALALATLISLNVNGHKAAIYIVNILKDKNDK